jgi:hypothetical protein
MEHSLEYTTEKSMDRPQALITSRPLAPVKEHLVEFLAQTSINRASAGESVKMLACQAGHMLFIRFFGNGWCL